MISKLEKRIGYVFQNKALIQQALVHSSYANERKINKLEDYERIEFLGDAVLELVSSDFLYKEHPKMPEGQLTKNRSSMVCEPSLAFCARAFGLEQFIYLGKGEEACGGRKKDSIVSDVLEAVIGAIYLDGGFEPAKAFIHRFVLNDLDKKKLFYDSKSTLQELVQSTHMGVITYQVLDITGPEHNQDFYVEVRVDDKALGAAHGHSKKAAEQKAAYEALLRLRG